MSATLVVLGAGAWGTAISLALFRAGNRVRLLPRFEHELAHLRTNRENTDWLPDVALPEAIAFGPCYDDVTACSETFANADAVFWVIPVQFSVGVARSLAGSLPVHAPLVICSKGLVCNESDGQTELLSTALAKYLRNPLCVLSGPNFAREVAKNLYTSAVVAAEDAEVATAVAGLIRAPTFRPYVSNDVVSVQVAGAIKNVIAIACGMAAGLELGQNAVASILAMGLAECGQISRRCGGQRDTLLGVSGVGDVTLTCLSVHSRNTGFGLRIGRGEIVADVLAGCKQAVEGYFTTKPAYILTQQLGLHAPVLDAVFQILYAGAEPRPTLTAVLAAPQQLEREDFGDEASTCTLLS